MFNYIRNDQPPKKTSSDSTCIYLETTMPPAPMPVPPTTMPPMPMPVPPTTMPPVPCSQCTHCMHYNMCMQVPMPDPYCDMSKNHDDMEVAYLNKMYPPVCQKIQKYIEAELNQYDHKLSPIYEMYPSTETIEHMANCIYTDMKAAMPSLIKGFECNLDNTRSPIGGSFYTLIYTLLLNELYRKRMRRRLYK